MHKFIDNKFAIFFEWITKLDYKLLKWLCMLKQEGGGIWYYWYAEENYMDMQKTKFLSFCKS